MLTGTRGCNAVEDGDGAMEAVRRRIIFRDDERLEVVRPATENELRGLRLLQAGFEGPSPHLLCSTAAMEVPKS